MFNLDQAIEEWRQQMAAGGMKNPEVLEELESHLREEVDRQVQEGLRPEEAFEEGARRLGNRCFPAQFSGPGPFPPGIDLVVDGCKDSGCTLKNLEPHESTCHPALGEVHLE